MEWAASQRLPACLSIGQSASGGTEWDQSHPPKRGAVSVEEGSRYIRTTVYSTECHVGAGHVPFFFFQGPHRSRAVGWTGTQPTGRGPDDTDGSAVLPHCLVTAPPSNAFPVTHQSAGGRARQKLRPTDVRGHRLTRVAAGRAAPNRCCNRSMTLSHPRTSAVPGRLPSINRLAAGPTAFSALAGPLLRCLPPASPAHSHSLPSLATYWYPLGPAAGGKPPLKGAATLQTPRNYFATTLGDSGLSRAQPPSDGGTRCEV